MSYYRTSYEIKPSGTEYIVLSRNHKIIARSTSEHAIQELASRLNTVLDTAIQENNKIFLVPGPSGCG